MCIKNARIYYGVTKNDGGEVEIMNKMQVLKGNYQAVLEFYQKKIKK